MINQPLKINEYVPRHYNREYPLFVEFLNNHFNYLHRSQNLSPEAYMQRVERFVANGMSESMATRRADAITHKRPATEFRDQLPFTRKPREYKQVALTDLILRGNNGETLLFREDHQIETDAMMDDRGMKPFFRQLSSGVKSIDPVRFYRLMRDFKASAGSNDFIKLYFSWLYEGEIEVTYPRENIMRLDENFILDSGDNRLRDDKYYSEFSYVVKCYGEPKVYNPEIYIEMYRKHFHPAGFGLFVETSVQDQNQVFEYPILVPTKNIGSYYALNNPIVVSTGETLELIVYLNNAITDITGPIFDGVSYDGTYFSYDESIWELLLDGVKIYPSTVVDIDLAFHTLSFNSIASEDISIDSFLKAVDFENEEGGGLPIERIRKISEGVTTVDYRINTLSEQGIADSFVEWDMCKQLQGKYEFQEGSVFEITELLEPNTTYIVFINGYNTSGSLNLQMGSADDTQSIIDFEQASAGVTAFLNQTLTNALDPEGEAPDAETDRSKYIDIDGDISFETNRYWWSFFNTGDTATKLVASNAGDLTEVQFVVWKYNGNLLTFENTSGKFIDTGFWIESVDSWSEDDYKERWTSVINVENLVSRLSYFINTTLPLSTLIEEPELTAERLKEDEINLRDVITNTLMSGMSTSNIFDISVSNYANSVESLNYFINEVLPNAVKNFDQADQDLAGEMANNFTENSTSLEEFVNSILPNALKRSDD